MNTKLNIKWNPFINAIGAAGYIWGIGSLIHLLSMLHHDQPDGFYAPIAALSMIVFSVAVMAFLFFYRPVVLLVEGKKIEAFNFFLKTLLTFGAITLIAVLIVL